MRVGRAWSLGGGSEGGVGLVELHGGRNRLERCWERAEVGLRFNFELSRGERGWQLEHIVLTSTRVACSPSLTSLKSSPLSLNSF